MIATECFETVLACSFAAAHDSKLVCSFCVQLVPAGMLQAESCVRFKERPFWCVPASRTRQPHCAAFKPCLHSHRTQKQLLTATVSSFQVERRWLGAWVIRSAVCCMVLRLQRRSASRTCLCARLGIGQAPPQLHIRRVHNTSAGCCGPISTTPQQALGRNTPLRWCVRLTHRCAKLHTKGGFYGFRLSESAPRG